MLHNKIIKKYKGETNLGFGLVELMVSIGIVVLVMGIIISKHSSYNGAVLLRSQAYSVALQTREIQLAAVSAANSGSAYRNVMGLYFNTNINSSSFYYNFIDANGNYYYDSSEVFGKRNNIDKRFQIDAIRLISGVSSTNVSELSVIFERPNFDARFFTAANTPAAANVNAVEIDIRLKGTTGSGDGAVRTVEVTKTGQITVK